MKKGPIYPHSKYEEDLEELRTLVSSMFRDRKNSQSILSICQKLPFYSKLVSTIMRDAHTECLLSFFDGAFIEVHPPSTPLIVENDTSNMKAYVLLKGEVGIVQSKNKSPWKDDKSETSGDNSDSLYEGVEEGMKRSVRQYGGLVNRVKVGQIFGEIALVTKSPRSATAITLCDSELLVFHRKNFLHVMKFYTADYISKKTELERLWPEVNMIEDNKKLAHLVQGFSHISYKRVVLCLIRMIM